MSVTPKAGDLGIILSKTGDASGAYVDISGTTQQSTAITGSYTAQGDAPVHGPIRHDGSSADMSVQQDMASGCGDAVGVSCVDRPCCAGLQCVGGACAIVPDMALNFCEACDPHKFTACAPERCVKSPSGFDYCCVY